jgi:hypothetical protein
MAMPEAHPTDGPTPRGPQRAKTLRGQKWINLVVRTLLRTPVLCRIIGKRLIIVHVIGRSSGRRYAIPVAYQRDGDGLLIGTSFAWGRNLRTDDPVAITLKGKLALADVRVSTSEADVIAGYATMARANPTFARLSGVRINDGGEPDHQDLRLAWAGGARVARLTPRADGAVPRR